MAFTRRKFFTAVVAAGGGAAGFYGARFIEYLGSPPSTPWKALAPDEAETLDALAEEMIPRDEHGPGAHDLKVVRFIDWQLAPGAPYERHLKTYREHLVKVKGMPAAEVEKKYKGFFDLVLGHVKLGYWGNPRHGGNYNYGAYRMLDISGPACTGRDVPPKA